MAVLAPTVGKLPASIAAIFTAVDPCFVKVKLCNPIGGTPREITLGVDGEPFLNFVMAAGTNYPAGASDAIYLDAGGTIDGEAAAAGEVSFVVTGVEL